MPTSQYVAANINILLVKITAQKCKLYNNALYVSGHVTVHIWINYSTVLLTIQQDIVTFTISYCKQITIVTVIFTVLHWRLCCQHGTVKFTINILQCITIYITMYLSFALLLLLLAIFCTLVQRILNFLLFS